MTCACRNVILPRDLDERGEASGTLDLRSRCGYAGSHCTPAGKLYTTTLRCPAMPFEYKQPNASAERMPKSGTPTQRVT
jgi:hypothetical protein